MATKNPSPKADALRAMREANYAARQTAQPKKPVKKTKPRRKT